MSRRSLPLLSDRFYVPTRYVTQEHRDAFTHVITRETYTPEKHLPKRCGSCPPPGTPLDQTDRSVQAARRASDALGTVALAYSVAGTGNRLDAVLWNRSAPVDGGPYTVSGTAPGHETWQTTVEVAATADKVSVETAWEAIDPALRGDTIVIVTVTDGDDQFIY